MKQTNSFNYSRRSRWLLPVVMLFALLTSANPAWAQELTVNDGTTTNSYVPLYGNWADAYLKCEFVIPASDLTEMSGKKVQGMKFYAYSSSVSWTGTFQVFLKEVETTTLSAYSGTTDATTVYTGTLSVTSKEMSITFNSDYTYNGGNLLVGVYQTVPGNYTSCSFYGVSATSGASIYGYNSSSLDGVTATAQSFLPKVTFTYQIEGPAMKVYDGTTAITTGYNYPFGLSTAGTTKEFTLSNPGTEAAPITIGHTGNFGISPTSTSIPAGESVTLTVTMPEASGNDVITISSTSNAIADFTINVSGTVRDPNKMWCDFSEGVPTGWTNSGSWSIATSGAGEGTSGAGYAYNTSYGTNKLMYSPLVTIAEGEKLYLMAKGYGSTASWNVLKIQYSADGTNWTTAKDLSGISNSGWQSIEVTEIPAGNWYIGFYGSYAYFTDVYGGKESTAPVIALSQNSYDFGLISTSTTTPTPITITNTGKSALTGLNITSDNANFTVAVTDNVTTIAANGGTATFNVTMAPNATGAQSATITIASENADDLIFTATGAVAKPGTTTAIFNDEILAGWTKAGNTSFNSDETAAYFNYSYTNYLTAPKVNIVADDFLAIDAKLSQSYGYVTVQGSADGSSWTDIKKLDSSVLNQSDYTTAIISGISTDYKYLRLNGYYCYVKEVAGLTYVAELSVTTGDPAVAVSTPANYDFKECKKDESVTYNFANASSVGTINITNVAITGDGAPAYSTNWTTSVAAPFDLVITRTYAERDGAQDAVVTVTTSEGDFVINVTGTDWAPITAFPWNENFNGLTAGIPAGWDNAEGTTTTDYYKWNYYDTGHNGACVRFDSFNNPEDKTNFLKTPIMNLPAGKVMQLGFWYKNPAGGDFSVYISKDGGETYETELATGLTGQTDWKEVLITLPEGFQEQENVVIVFKGTSNYGSSGAYIDLDDVSVQEQEDGANFAINTDGSAQDFGSVKANATAEKTYTVSNSGNKNLVVTLDAEEGFTATGNALLFTNTKGWTNVYVHAWGTSGNLTTWPGNEALYYGKNNNEEDQYLIIVPEGATGIVIDSGNNGQQTQDITNFNVTGYYLTGDLYDSNKYWAESWGDAPTVLNVAAGESETFKVAMDTATPGDKSGNVTLTFTALNAESPFTIPCTGNVKDPSVLEVDFEDGQFPTGWQVGANWSVDSTGGNHYAVQSQTSLANASAFVTTPLTFAENETLTFKVMRNLTGSASYKKSLKVRYSTDGGVNWSEYKDYGDEFGSSFAQYELTDVPAGTVIVEFFGNNIKIDDIQGVKNATKAAIALSEVIDENTTAVACGDTKNFGYLSANGTATYRVKNIGTATLNANLSVTEGKGLTVSPANISIEAGQTADVIVTLAYGEPYGDRNEMNLTIDSEDEYISDFVVNFEANLVDPTDFVEDFENGKPAGWYLDTWTVSDGTAHILGTAKPMITELVGAEEGKNTLSFDAKLQYDYGYGTYTVSVSTSTDRKNWSDPQEFTLSATSQTFSLDELSDGVYYVKFEAANATIDNIKGVKKLALPEHDLYLISSTLPTEEIMPGSDYKATVNVASLVATENVKAELYFGNTMTPIAEKTQEVGSTASTIELTCTAPAAGTYDVYAIISVGNTEVRTATASVTVTDKTELSLTGFTRTSTSSVTADENNEFTAEFNVTVKNTGSTSFAADEVSVTVTDLDNNPYQTTTWTPAETIYLKAGNYTADGAKLAIYRWSTNEDQEWAFFTGGTDDIYTASLNGKENFIIVRLKKSGDDGYDSTNDGLNWNNKHNQSDNLTTATGVVFENNGYEDGKLNMTQSNNFIAGMSATINVSVTAAAGEGGEFKFNVKEDVSDAYWYPNTGDYLSVNVTAAPTIVLNENSSEPFATGSNRKARLTRTFTSTWNTICLPFAVEAGDVESKFGEGALVYAFTDYADGALRFDKMTGDMAASTPYLIYTPNAPAEAIEFTNVSIASTEPGNVENNEVTFQGTYTPIAAGEGSALDGAYGISSDNRIAKGNDKTSMKGFRAYLTGVPSLSGARIAIFDETTGITRIYGAEEIFGKDDKVYDLNGRRVETAKKGVYIVNGRKMVVK